MRITLGTLAHSGRFDLVSAQFFFLWVLILGCAVPLLFGLHPRYNPDGRPNAQLNMAQLFSERHSYLDYPSWPLYPDHPVWPTTSDSTPPSPSISPTPSVKVEPDDNPGCFIMELSPPQVQTSLLSQSLAPPTEVPLRATQASKKMRGMMTVFRLNPFAIHSGEGRGLVSAIREEARPLDEEPLIFEFQLDIDGMHPDEPDIASQQLLYPFSPDFELHDMPHDGDSTPTWEDSSRSESSYPTTPSWELRYPPTLASEAHYPLPEDPSSTLHHSRHTISRLQNCTYPLSCR